MIIITLKYTPLGYCGQLEWDADLVSWLEGMAPGSRSALIRDTLQMGLRQPARSEPMDIDEMRRVVAEELARALAGRQVAYSATAPPVEDIEGKYGAKLDRMLGGLGDWVIVSPSHRRR
jgi:hypothetical protein